ncbi:MAG: PAS domain S-box protein [Clostridia bacterium]|nr:PAS domain S-box protein [Clostridia bacterium]
MLGKLFKSILEQDTSPIVVCDLNDIIVYMNPTAKRIYHKDLTGSNLKDCHNEKSNEMIDKVVSWFKESRDHNSVFTFYSRKENKDVYMVALRDNYGTLIGYYEKHEYRNREAAGFYEPVR